MLEEKLNDLIRIFHEREIVERIAGTKNAEERNTIYYEEKWTLQTQLLALKQEMLAVNEESDSDEGAINPSYEISPKNAIQIGVICMMAEIDDCDLFANYESLAVALREIEGDLADTAKEMANFLIFDGEDEEEAEEEAAVEGEFFSDYKPEELLEGFFG